MKKLIIVALAYFVVVVGLAYAAFPQYLQGAPGTVNCAWGTTGAQDGIVGAIAFDDGSQFAPGSSLTGGLLTGGSSN
jgi:hypothetical protein